MQIITYWKRGFLENYANFKGRDTRPEFWWFYLANVILTYGLFILGGITGASILGLIGLLYGLAVIVPGIAAGVRRLHDTGKTGWLMLVSLIPLVGGIILIVLLAQPGTPGANEYGQTVEKADETQDACACNTAEDEESIGEDHVR